MLISEIQDLLRKHFGLSVSYKCVNECAKGITYRDTKAARYRKPSLAQLVELAVQLREAGCDEKEVERRFAELVDSAAIVL